MSLPEISKPNPILNQGINNSAVKIDPVHQSIFNIDHISNRLAPEIKKIFKEHNLELKTFFILKREFQNKDIYAFSFANDKELKFFIENIGITNLPDLFITYMYQSIVNPLTRKINYLLLK